MKTRDKIIAAAVVGVVAAVSFTAFAAVKALKQLGEIALDLPNDPLLQSFIGTNKEKE